MKTAMGIMDVLPGFFLHLHLDHVGESGVTIKENDSHNDHWRS